MSTNKKVSLIIVNYNSSKYLRKLLLSRRYIHERLKETIIIDNNSRNDQIKKIKKFKNTPDVKIVLNKKNVGFSKAVNQAIEISRSPIILLANPDSYFIDKSPLQSITFLEKHKDAVLIGGKIFDQNGKQKYSANTKPNFLTGLFEFTNLKKIFPNNRFSKHFWPEKQNNDEQPFEVDSVCGAYMIFKKVFRKKINNFDPNYFLYLEDLDFGLKIKKNNGKVFFDPRSKICHLGSKSNTSKYHIVLKHWYKSRKLFFCKNISSPSNLLLWVIFTIEEKILWIYHIIRNQPNE